MRIPKSFFLIYCLVLTNLLTAGYAVFIQYFQSGYEIKQQIVNLEKKIERTEFENRVAQNQILDLQQTMAETLPPEKKMIAEQRINSQWKGRAFSLSQQLREPASIKKIDLSGVYFEKGKKLFTQKKYHMAFKEFEALKEKFPLSDRAVESTFLMLESSYLQKDYKKTVDIADYMVTQYPESLLTGYAILRLGLVSEKNSQFEEASALYKIVAEHFRDERLKNQALDYIKRISLE